MVGITKGKIPTKDKNGNTIVVDIDDSRILSGELRQVNKDMIVAKDKFGNSIRVFKHDLRYLSGELVGISKGKKFYKWRVVE